MSKQISKESEQWHDEMLEWYNRQIEKLLIQKEKENSWLTKWQRRKLTMAYNALVQRRKYHIEDHMKLRERIEA